MAYLMGVWKERRVPLERKQFALTFKKEGKIWKEGENSGKKKDKYKEGLSSTKTVSVKAIFPSFIRKLSYIT